MRRSENLSPPGVLRRLACMSYEAIILVAVVLLGLLLPQALLGALAHRAASATTL